MKTTNITEKIKEELDLSTVPMVEILAEHMEVINKLGKKEKPADKE